MEHQNPPLSLVEQPVAQQQSLQVAKETSSAIKAAGWNTLRTRQTLAGTFATTAGAVVVGFAATVLSGPALPLIATGGVAIALLGVNIFNQGMFGDKYKQFLSKVGLRPSDIGAFMGFLAVGAFAANAITAFATGVAVVGAGAAEIPAALGKVEALFLAVSATFFTILSASSLKESIDARRSSKHIPQEAGLNVKQETSSTTKGFHLPSWKGLTPNQAASSLIGAGALVVAAGGVMMTGGLTGGPLIIAAGVLYAAWGSMFLQNPLKKKEAEPEVTAPIEQAELDETLHQAETSQNKLEKEPSSSNEKEINSFELKSSFMNLKVDLKALKEIAEKQAHELQPIKHAVNTQTQSR